MGVVEGKVGIISSATSGIGARTAELFVEEGAKVVFTGRRRPEGDALAKRLGPNAWFVAADATLEDDWFYAKAAPIPRSGAPHDIAQCVLWLASDRSTFVNATDSVVAGGVLGGRNFAQHHEGLKHVRAALGLSWHSGR
jgi:NAD(P)-dependent dehydrogenase (short-subunit alcohol dehydrogenase family)